MAGKSLLLIGGTGFFGKSFLDAFQRGLLAPWGIERIIAVARNMSVLVQQYPQLLSDQVELIEADVGTAADLPTADYVIHAASSTDARLYASDPEGQRRNILAALDNYARIALVRHRDARIVYASSGAVYGTQPADLAKLSEDFAGIASDPAKAVYAEAKRAAEARFAELGASGLNIAVARCFAFVGLYLPRDQHFAIGNFLADGMAGRPITVKARHRVYRSYMYADDLVRWLMTLADAAHPACPIYNVGSDEALDMGEIAGRVAAKFRVAVDVPESASATVDRYIPSIAKAGALGLKVEFSLNDALDAIIARL